MPSGTSFFSVNIRIAPRTLIVALLVAACFALSHAYSGIRHDGIAYLGEALVQLDPARMSDDLFFLFGSQAAFTIVPHIYAATIAWLGIGDGTRLLLALSLSAFFLASVWLLRPLVESRLLFWSLIVLFIGAPVYGGHQVFAYGEPFFTARSLAEPLVLFGLGWLVRKRAAIAITCMVAAMFVHPLIALPGLLLVWCWLVFEDRRWLWSALVGIVPVALGLVGVAPFDDLFKRYDASWMEVVQEANPCVFPLNWHLSDWALVVFDLGVVVGITRLATPMTPSMMTSMMTSMARLARAAGAAGVIGLVMGSIGADLLSNVLLTGLQLWRSLWLMHWTAMAGLCVVLWHLWNQDNANDRAAALLLIASVLSLTTFGPLLLVPGAFALSFFPRRLPVTRDLVRALGVFCVALAAVLLARQVAAVSPFIAMLGGSLAVQISRPLSMTLVLFGVVVTATRYLPKWPAPGALVAASLLVVAVAGWDQREKWTRYQEDYASNHGLLWKETVAPSDRVYWFREVRAPWLMMRHANYYSPSQASGVLFNRRTAIELGERAKMIALLEFQESICRAMNNLNKSETSCEPDVEVVRDICDSAERLVFVVLQSALPVRPAAELRTGFIEHDYEKTFYLYRCADVAAR